MSASTIDLPLSREPKPSGVQQGGRIPPLVNGDRLTASEFERRFDAMPGLKQAELINGVVYMPPAKEETHGRPHFKLTTFYGIYELATPGVIGGVESTLRLDQRSRPQPDIYLRISQEHGGQSKLDADGYVAAGPELITEVAATSAGYDLHDKLDLYEAYQVKEYVVWRTFDEALDWFELTDEGYKPMPAGDDGVLRSRVMPGLWIDRAALLAGDFEKLLRILNEGIASAEHQAFVEKLKCARTT